MNSLKVGALCALLTVGAIVPLASLAQNPPASAPAAKMHKACAKCAKAGMKECACPVPMKGSVYLCKDCKMYFTPAQAKKMGFKDPMGHKMAKVRASKIPAGYKEAGKMGTEEKKTGMVEMPRRTLVSTCPMTGEKVEGAGVGMSSVDSYDVKFCCAGCKPAFDKLTKAEQLTKIQSALGAK
jgi:hypothetical protein